jgi:hypothetical protein
MTVESKLTNQFISCECGCKTKIPKYNNKGKLRHYVNGHERRGKHHNIDSKVKLRTANLGSKNPMYGKSREGLHRENNFAWKGDKVGYHGLHNWVRKYLPKPEFCSICLKYRPTDLANVTGIYNRDFENWDYFCHQCHIRHDILKRIVKRICN